MAPINRTRILVVDDSAVMRSLLRSVVSSDSTLEVAGTAADGQEIAQSGGAGPGRHLRAVGVEVRIVKMRMGIQ